MIIIVCVNEVSLTVARVVVIVSVASILVPKLVPKGTVLVIVVIVVTIIVSISIVIIRGWGADLETVSSSSPTVISVVGVIAVTIILRFFAVAALSVEIGTLRVESTVKPSVGTIRMLMASSF